MTTEAATAGSAAPPAAAELTFGGAQAMLADQYRDDPVQLQASLDALHRGYTDARVALTTQRLQQQVSLGAAIDKVNAALAAGIDSPEKGQALVAQIGTDPAFAADTTARANAYQVVRDLIDAQAAGASPQGPGPQFIDTLARLGNGEPIAKPALLAMQAQGGLTPQGYQQLKDASTDPSEARMLNAALTAARARLSSGPQDAQGNAIFGHFLPTILTQYQAARAAGTPPLDLLAPGGKDDLATPLVALFGGMRTAAPTADTPPSNPNLILAADEETPGEKLKDQIDRIEGMETPDEARKNGHGIPIIRNPAAAAPFAVPREPSEPAVESGPQANPKSILPGEAGSAARAAPLADLPRIPSGDARYTTIGNQRFVTPEGGSPDLGRIAPDVAASIGRQSAPIRLPEGDSRYGDLHLASPERAAQLRAAGYDDPAQLAATVAHDYDEIYQGREGRLLLVKRVPSGTGTAVHNLVIELGQAIDGDYWTIITGGVLRRDYFGRQDRKLLWRKGGASPDPSATGGPSP